MNYVYADLTPFYDRWGKRHTRLIAKGSLLKCLLKAVWWTQCHQHGSAFISKREIPEKELNG